MAGDVFDTAAIRGRVLDAWTASPARFREDANTEEDFALGGYRDRLVVELAQNAADAASKAGVPGQLRLTLSGGVLAAANTGTPLDAAGVEALSTLRASAKRDSQTVGRFGVGFAAVLAVTDEPSVISSTGGVRWSLREARDLVAAVPALWDEYQRRQEAVPALRLPFPAEGRPPDGYDTAVLLPLRDAGAEALARRLLADVDDALLLGLEGLAEVTIEVDGQTRVLSATRAEGVDASLNEDAVEIRDDDRVTVWRLARAGGSLDPELLTDRPTEERLRAWWSVTWAVPVGDDRAPRSLPASTASVVHAPTPTDEALGLPALLLASFPLEPQRRHVAPGPLCEFLVDRSALTYLSLLRSLAPTPALLRLVPGPVAAGELDARLRRAILDVLPDCPLLPAAGDPTTRLRPCEAVAIEDASPSLVAALEPAVPGLLPAGWERDRSALAAGGARLLSLGEVVELVGTLDREPAWWASLYAALLGADREALAGLPIPLVDGRLVHSPRGVLLPAGEISVDALRALGLRVAHPEAVHPMLERLGAVPATAVALVEDPAVRGAVAASADADDPDALAEAVLTLVEAAQPVPGELPWLAELGLRDADDEICPAGELVLPGSPIADVLEDDALGVVGPSLVARWGEEVLEAVGVLRTFALVRDEDVVLDPASCDHDLDGEDMWVEEMLSSLRGVSTPAVLPEFVAVRDLDLVRSEAWPQALRLLAQPPLREAVTEPVRVLPPDGGPHDIPSYTAWWLRRNPVLCGHRPTELRASDADPELRDLYDPVDADIDSHLARALGVRTTFADMLAEPRGADELLARLADPARTVAPDHLHGVYAALVDASAERTGPPERVQALVDGRPDVVPRADAVVIDAPDLLPLVRGRPVLVVPAPLAPALADLLDVPLASERHEGAVGSRGEERPVPEAARELLPGLPATYREHDPLLVDGVEVDWRYVDGVVHAATLEGLARALAWAAGRWDRRYEVLALLAEPDRAVDLRIDRYFE